MSKNRQDSLAHILHNAITIITTYNSIDNKSTTVMQHMGVSSYIADVHILEFPREISCCFKISHFAESEA